MSMAERLLALLGESPLDCDGRDGDKARRAFPIPCEHRLLWADAEFDLRPSGVACTDRGVLIRTNERLLRLPGKKEAAEDEKSILLYYPWASFEPSWFAAVDRHGGRLPESRCIARFSAACASLAAQMNKAMPSAALIGAKHPEAGDPYAAPVAGLSVQAAETAVFAEQKSRANTKTGHGEMAEEAISMLDDLAGLNGTVVGRDNAKDGPDRLVGGDIYIQTKYYQTARGSLEACFDEKTGLYRYFRGGEPMQLEVPRDQYDRAVELFREKIAEGLVPGVTDPAQAAAIVRQGRLTYQQAVNLTKPGTIESLAYDAGTGAVTCACAFGVTFAAAGFLAWRRTKDMRKAVRAGAAAGANVFGRSFVQHLLVSQLARTELAVSLLEPGVAVVSRWGKSAVERLVNGMRSLSGKSAIHGAAAQKQLARMLRSGALSSAVALLVFSLPDTYALATRRMSGTQYVKNMTVLAGSIVGGTAGAAAAGMVAASVAGAAGTAIAPGVGTVIGMAGGFLGGAAVSGVIDAVGDLLAEDDAVRWNRLFSAMVSCLCGEYLLDEDEISALTARLNALDDAQYRELFAQLHCTDAQEAHLRAFLAPHFDAIAQERAHFALPDAREMVMALSMPDIG